jgi:hypothetical protein
MCGVIVGYARGTCFRIHVDSKLDCNQQCKNMLNTSFNLDGSPMSIRSSTEINNARNATYISQFGWNS